LQEQLERNELRPISLYKKVRTREVSEEELRRFDPSGLSFRNMNSPEDYQEALALWRERQRQETETEPTQTNKEKKDKDPGSSSASSDSISPLCLIIELFGVARLRAKTDSISLHLPPGATLTDALAALAAHSPALVGVVISLEDHTL